MKKVILLFVTVMAVVSCNEKKTLEALGGEWNVVTIGEMAVSDSVGAFIGFDLAENIVYGSTGCNQIAGALPAGVNPEEPMFAALGSTRKMCADMTVEDAMLPALAEAMDFVVDGDNLSLINAEGQTVMSLQKR